MTDTDIKNEVVNLIEATPSQPMPAAWIVQSIVKNHPLQTGIETDFYLCCAYAHVRAVVRSTLQSMRKRDNEAEGDPQMILPGFDRLQLRYVVGDDDGQIVPIELLTPDQIKEKIQELRRMARGCVEHADELERYLSQRAAA